MKMVFFILDDLGVYNYGSSRISSAKLFYITVFVYGCCLFVMDQVKSLHKLFSIPFFHIVCTAVSLALLLNNKELLRHFQSLRTTICSQIVFLVSKKSINGKVDTVTSPVKSTVALEMFFISLNFLFVVVTRRLAH